MYFRLNSVKFSIYGWARFSQIQQNAMLLLSIGRFVYVIIMFLVNFLFMVGHDLQQHMKILNQKKLQIYLGVF